MCLQKRKIYTNSHRIYRYRNSQYTINTPCGDCTECRKAKANEWRARTYYEYLDTITKGGFALWDRLSYDDENLPHLAALEKGVPENLDFTCFNREHIQEFLKRLRSNLEYEGHEPKGKLRYLIAAEYGQEEGRYMADKGYMREGTLRPHYHAIIYSTDNTLTPAELSMHIKKAWQMGTTNGIEDNPVYFTEKGVIRTKADAITISDYIGKYCLKNQSFDKVANYKIRELHRHYTAAERGLFYEDIDDKELKTKKNRERINRCKRKVATFHLQSKGYGMTAIFNEKAMDREGLLGMPDKDKIWWYQPLPMYFQRKIYYNHKRTKEGKVIWYMTEKGMEWKIRTIKKAIENQAKKIDTIKGQAQDHNFNTLIENYNRDNQIKTDPQKTWERINDLVYAYQNGRPTEHYAEYILFHQGRIWTGRKMDAEETIRLNYRSAIEAENEPENSEKLYYNYTHTTDKDHFGKRMIGHEDLGDKWKGYKRTHGDELKPQDFEKLFTTNEETLDEWNNYDKLTDILNQIRAYIEWNDSAAERRRRDMELTWKGKTKTLYKNIL